MDSISSIKVIGEIGKTELGWLRNLLDHAWFEKSEVTYNHVDKELMIKLKRYKEKTKARKKFLGLTIWCNTIRPTQESLLTIKDIEECNIRDDDPQNPKRKQVISGGVTVSGNDIYIGSFCDHENPYGISLKVKRINIGLEDIS